LPFAHPNYLTTNLFPSGLEYLIIYEALHAGELVRLQGLDRLELLKQELQLFEIVDFLYDCLLL